MKKQRIIRTVMYVWGAVLLAITVAMLIGMINDMGQAGASMYASRDAVEFVARGCWG